MEVLSFGGPSADHIWPIVSFYSVLKKYIFSYAFISTGHIFIFTWYRGLVFFGLISFHYDFNLFLALFFFCVFFFCSILLIQLKFDFIVIQLNILNSIWSLMKCLSIKLINILRTFFFPALLKGVFLLLFFSTWLLMINWTYASPVDCGVKNTPTHQWSIC